MIRRTLLGIALAAVTMTGCARTVVVDPQETSYDPNDLNAQLDFWSELPGRSAITNDEGIHGVILITEGTDTSGSYENRLTYLEERGWLSDSLAEEEPNVAMQRGTLASILTHALDIEGGVMMRLTDKSPRYAYRELVYMGIMPAGSEQMVLDGLDYLGVITVAQEMMRVAAMQAPEPEAELEAEPVLEGDGASE